MPNTPRKTPKQARSREIVESVLVAAFRLLPKRGLVHATTNHIAELAGVSVGSLYQYFPNKEAIFARLIDRELSKNEAELLGLLEERRGESLAFLAEIMVSTMVDHYLDQGAAVRELFAHAFQLGEVQRVVTSRTQAHERLSRLLAEHPEIDTSRDLVKASEVLVGAIFGVLQHVLLSGGEAGPRDALKAELTRLVLGYLKKS